MGCELGQAFVRLGSGVQIVEAEPTLLPAEDRAAGRFIGEALAGEGAELHLGAPRQPGRADRRSCGRAGRR
jgi:pyruvate/2-oxoglutarate dehydrogenase complex dihydrolipoamide dehydrogenase (E3) component